MNRRKEQKPSKKVIESVLRQIKKKPIALSESEDSYLRRVIVSNQQRERTDLVVGGKLF